MKIHRKITAQDSDNLSRYFSEIRNFESLTKEQELELIKKIQKDGDPAAFNILIKANLKFVISVAKVYQGQGAHVLDLVSEGNMGLIEAAKSFDKSWDIKFFSYAVWWIRKKMFTSINMHKRNIRLPDNRWLLVDKIKRESQALEQVLNRQPNLDELCEHLKELDEQEIKEALIHTGTMPSLQDRVSTDEDDEGTLEDTIADASMGIDDISKSESIVSDLNRFLYFLTQHEYDIIILAIGLNNEPAKKNEDVAVALGLKQKDIVKLKSKAIKKLRKIRSIDSLKDYL